MTDIRRYIQMQDCDCNDGFVCVRCASIDTIDSQAKEIARLKAAMQSISSVYQLSAIEHAVAEETERCINKVWEHHLCDDGCVNIPNIANAIRGNT